ncbi:MAG: hypothetical protein MJ169_08900 [Treponema sp.]|nr:hypothetical protein [Treponema sp.]
MQKEWKQPELFDWDAPDVFIPVIQKKKKVKKPVDYEKLYQLFCEKKTLTFAEIEAASGVSHNAVAQVITTLSLRYPICDIKRGVYMLCDASDYE